MSVKKTVVYCCLAAMSGWMAACSPSAPGNSQDLGASSSSLTVAECNYFDVAGKVRICHATGSAKNPYAIV